eukprot:NODE_13942_length_1137_cov_5.784158.p2 GENE.NODE_13942_length_1137_cov_5.784158~~NODE_13942_length_1137_cov_5.784158.p2  ORF type:complete len:149 (+),score=28.50 NODE_13942_length_1137_cov_5.784158:600-1046(+)
MMKLEGVFSLLPHDRCVLVRARLALELPDELRHGLPTAEIQSCPCLCTSVAPRNCGLDLGVASISAHAVVRSVAHSCVSVAPRTSELRLGNFFMVALCSEPALCLIVFVFVPSNSFSLIKKKKKKKKKKTQRGKQSLKKNKKCPRKRR